MKKILLDSKLTQYKANMHTHSTVSDGLKTPEDLRDMYMANGYSIVAYTDHDIFVCHNDLSNERFLALNGFELGGFAEYGKSNWEAKVCHICYVALEPDNVRHPVWHRSKYLYGNAVSYRDTQAFYEDEPDFERSYTPECINEAIRRGREKGFFVTHNHPYFSLEEPCDYLSYEGHSAFEIMNYVSNFNGISGCHSVAYDALLRQGKRLVAIAGDDNHNFVHDSFGAFTMIAAERLEYREITKALEEGRCYASEGPEIKEIWVEDGKLHVKSSPAKHIKFSSNSRWGQTFFGENGELITEAEYEILPEVKYMRITIVDDHNRCAYSRGYFIDELLPQNE